MRIVLGELLAGLERIPVPPLLPLSFVFHVYLQWVEIRFTSSFTKGFSAKVEATTILSERRCRLSLRCCPAAARRFAPIGAFATRDPSARSG